MITRKEYMNRNSACYQKSKDKAVRDECTSKAYNEYMSQFVTDYTRRAVRIMFDLDSKAMGKRNLKTLFYAFLRDRHLNEIDLGIWDSMAVHMGTQRQRELLKEAGDGLSLSHGVGVLKQSAKHILIEAWMNREFDYLGDDEIREAMSQPNKYNDPSCAFNIFAIKRLDKQDEMDNDKVMASS